MPDDQSPIDKVGNNLGKWLLGTISTITVVVSFVNMMRGNFQLGVLIFAVLITLNLLLGLLYIIFQTKPVSSRSKKRMHPYEKYRTAAIAGVALLVIAVSVVLSMRSNREFIAIAMMGTPTATAGPTSTPLPPKTTMLVTVKDDHPCLIDGMGIFDGMLRRDTLDIGINNNSNRDLLITSAILKPIWISYNQWMGPTPINASYDVSVAEWWSEFERLPENVFFQGPNTPAPEPEILSRIARVGHTFWFQPSPIEVKEIIGDKYTIKRNSQERFEIVLGLSGTEESLWGSLIFEITTDDNQTLTSDPVEFAVCYEPISENLFSKPLRTAAQNPETNRNGITWFAWNDAAKQDSGGVVVEISRIVLAENSNGMDFAWVSDESWTSGEIFFKIQNNTNRRQLILPSSADINFNHETQFNYMLRGFGESLDGYIRPGETKIGSLQFTTADLSPSDIKNLQLKDIGCAFNDITGCSGPAFEFDIDLSTPANDPLPAEIRKLISP